VGVEDQYDIAQLREEHGRAVRAWHVAWLARVEWHARTFASLDASTDALLYDYVATEREALRAAEEKSYERYLDARAILDQTLRSKRRGGD
jgi:hypothetical protein